MAKGMPDTNLRQVTFGGFLVVVSVIVLLIALEIIDPNKLFSGDSADIFLAFAILALGLIYIYGFLNNG